MLGLFEVFILLCILFYVFNQSRAKEMVDVFKGHVQDAIGVLRLPSLQYAGQEHTENEVTTTGLRRFALERERQRIVDRSAEKGVNDSNLYQLKQTSPPQIDVSEKSTATFSCRTCSSANYEKRLKVEDHKRDIIDVLSASNYRDHTSTRSYFQFSTWIPFIVQSLKLKRFPYPQISGTVLKDERLQNAIKLSIKKTLEEKREAYRREMNIGEDDDDDFDEDQEYVKVAEEHNKRAKKILIDMSSKLSDVLLRVVSYIMYKVMPRFLSGVVAHPSQVEMLRNISNKMPNVPMIFIPLHRSHLDYILVTFILLNNNIRSPLVAAGDNLRIPFFGAVLRGLGAFYIKRKIDPVAGRKDIVYRAMLHTYMQHALAAGHNIEFFIEGGRTRTGKPCMPKSGVLSVIIDAFMDGTIPDALLVPVSVNYERLVDGNFVHEQLGQRKKPESFKSAVSAIWNILSVNCGQMRIDFNEPYSLSELVKAFNKSGLSDSGSEQPRSSTKQASMRRLTHQPSTSSLFGTDIVQEEHRMLVDSIARHVVYDSSCSTAVMSTNAVTFLLLTQFRDGAPVDVIAQALDELRAALKNVRNINFTGESKDVVLYAANLLGSKLITIEERNGQIFIKHVNEISSVIELSYYANSLNVHFALDAAMVSAIQKLHIIHEKTSSHAEFKTSKDEIFKTTLEFCDILKYEFLFNKPCQKMDDLLDETFDRLKLNEIVCVEGGNESQNVKMLVKKFSREFEFEDSDEDDSIHRIGENEISNVTIAPDGHEKRTVLLTAIAPFAHTYLAVAKSLHLLVDNALPEAEFIKASVIEITDKVDKFECKFGESISTDTIRNCMKMLEKLSIIQIGSTTGVRMVSLGTNERFDEIVERIQSFVLV